MGETGPAAGKARHQGGGCPAAQVGAGQKQQPVSLEQVQAALVGGSGAAQPQHDPQRGRRGGKAAAAVPAEGDEDGDKGVKAAEVGRDFFHVAFDVENLEDDEQPQKGAPHQIVEVDAVPAW